jgi:hypothetical protein
MDKFSVWNQGPLPSPTARSTTGIAFFVECLKHSAKAILHSAKPLPSVTLGKFFIGKEFFAEYFFRTLGKDFVECQKALGKENTRQINNRFLKTNSKTVFKILGTILQPYLLPYPLLYHLSLLF